MKQTVAESTAERIPCPKAVNDLNGEWWNLNGLVFGLSENTLGALLHNGNFNTFDDFYADAQDAMREMVRESNSTRKAKISRKGVDPSERIDQWQNKEAIAARTMKALENSSIIAKFADSIGVELDD